MTNISFSELRNNVRRVLKRLRDDKSPINVTLRDGESFVIMTKNDFEGWKKTLFLMSNLENTRRLKVAQEDFHNDMNNYHEQKLIDADE